MRQIQIATVCGVGMGTSLILRMTAEDAIKEMGLDAKVTATDASSVRSMGADVIMGQAMHTAELEGVAPVVITIKNFLSKEEIKQALEAALPRLQVLAG